MENSFQTSFIPKKPVNTSIRPTRPPTSFLTTFAFFVLIVVGLVAGGLFLYKNYLNNQKQVLSDSLQKVRDSFEHDTINELELYDKRASAAHKILAGHIVLSPMFALLGNLTIPSIQYTKFEHSSSNQGFQVKMSGTAIDYKSIALQADVFNSARGRSFKNVVFSNLVKDKKNNVGFDVQFVVDPSLLSYEKNLQLEQAQNQAAPIANPDISNQQPTDTQAQVPSTSQPQDPNQALPGGINTNNTPTNQTQ